MAQNIYIKGSKNFYVSNCNLIILQCLLSEVIIFSSINMRGNKQTDKTIKQTIIDLGTIVIV